MNKSNNAKVTHNNNSSSRSEYNCYDWRESRSFEIEDESMDLDQDRSMMGDATIEKLMENEQLFKDEKDKSDHIMQNRSYDGDRGNQSYTQGQSRDGDGGHNQSMDISMLDFSDML